MGQWGWKRETEVRAGEGEGMTPPLSIPTSYSGSCTKVSCLVTCDMLFAMQRYYAVYRKLSFSENPKM